MASGKSKEQSKGDDFMMEFDPAGHPFFYAERNEARTFGQPIGGQNRMNADRKTSFRHCDSAIEKNISIEGYL